MNIFVHYNTIFCDIDNTIIYGEYSNLMNKVWNLTQSKTLSRVMMYIQAYLKTYRTNDKLLFHLGKSEAELIFLTARCPSKATRKLVQDIVDKFNLRPDYTLLEIASYEHTKDKFRVIKNYIEAMNDIRQGENQNTVVIDDNNELLCACAQNFANCHIIDPSVYLEELI